MLILEVPVIRLSDAIEKLATTRIKHGEGLNQAAHTHIHDAVALMKKASALVCKTEIERALLNEADPYAALLEVIGSKHYQGLLTDKEIIAFKVKAVDAKLQRLRNEQEELIRSRITMERESTAKDCGDFVLVTEEEITES